MRIHADTALSEGVTGIVARATSRRPEELTPETRLVDHLGADAHTYAQIARLVADRYGLPVDGTHLCDDAATIGDLVTVVADRAARQAITESV
ncbi:MAG TPA: phosphopantetheine-binding protein [Yinghuangia sp.]|uniref:acyl carrier protein n=1 Tax=Yinghuangia sp. YIM S10712 TaxID=3436930 RepID=UPI002C60AC84|nr:phosphopantetheine-binding protein [Yinghuangia sp.]